MTPIWKVEQEISDHTMVGNAPVVPHFEAPSGVPSELGDGGKETMFTAKELEFQDGLEEALSTCAPVGELERDSLLSSLDDHMSFTSGASEASGRRKATGGLMTAEGSQAPCLN